MSQVYTWPPIVATTSTPFAAPNNGPIPAQAALIGGDDAGTLRPVLVDNLGQLQVEVTASVLPTGGATAANQATEIASLASIDSKLTSPLAVTGPLTDAELRASAVPVSAASLPLPTGAATAANQATEIASLASIDSKLTSPLAVTAASLPLPTGAATETTLAAAAVSLVSIDSKLTSPLAVTGPLTDTQLRASAVPVSLASAPLPTGAATEATLLAFSDKSAGALVPEAFDYIDLTYVGATTDINTAVYKLGGSGGTVVATLTMGYDGSNRLTSVTKT